MTQAKVSVVNYDCNSCIIVLATVITIVNYDHNSFIIQATENLFSDEKDKDVKYHFYEWASLRSLRMIFNRNKINFGAYLKK
jgi:hypothetical protein